jgi:histidinol dehydrogenase
MIEKQIIFLSREQIKNELVRPSFDSKSLFLAVSEIFENIKNGGDKQLLLYTKKFDGVELSQSQLEIDLEKTNPKIDSALENAIKIAYQNIVKFHSAQKREDLAIETQKGVVCYRKSKPIEKVGLYIPGGSAPLFSTVLMLAIPAQIAGCKEIILCTPPNKQGEIHPAILFAAKLCGIKKIYKVGGSQAIAAMTYGTETILQVYKIFGPGNQYVTAAKQFASLQGVAIDMPAGPSEVMVVADEGKNPTFIAADLLSQAEHGADSQVVLVSQSKELFEKVNQELQTQLELLPRKEIAQKSLKNAVQVLVQNDEEAIEVINEYAPEHLILMVENEDFYLDNIANAGSVFIGNFTPESAGDYASGTNHTLPTSGYAKQYSGVSLDSFMKYITYQKISEEGLKNIGPSIEIMAENEELMAHKNAVTLRLKTLK